MLLTARRRWSTSRPGRAAAEGAVDDVDRQARGLAEHPDRGAAEVGPGRVAGVAEEARVDDLDPAAPHEDGAPAAALDRLAGRVAVGEGQVLHGEPGVVLVLAVRGGPDLGLVAGVHVEDPALAAAAERDLAAAVEHDLRPGVVADLGGGRHRDRDRVRPAVERDDPAGRHRLDHGGRGAAGGRAGADDPVGVGGVDRAGLGWDAGPAGPGAGRACRGRGARPAAGADPRVAEPGCGRGRVGRRRGRGRELDGRRAARRHRGIEQVVRGRTAGRGDDRRADHDRPRPPAGLHSCDGSRPGGPRERTWRAVCRRVGQRRQHFTRRAADAGVNER